MRPLRPTRFGRAVPALLVAALLGAGAAGLVACGNQNGLLSSATGSSLQDQLNAVSDAVSNGDCNRALNASATLRTSIAKLPPSVDASLRRRLTDGSRTVAAKATTACHQHTQSTPTTTTVPTVTTPTVPTQTQTVPTQTTTTTAPTTPTTPTVPTTPTPTPPTTGPGKGNSGGGAGNGGGSDNGSGGGASPIP